MAASGTCAAAPGVDPPAPAPGVRRPKDWAGAVQRTLDDPRSIGLVFQPIVDLARATVTGYEALARFPPLAPSRTGHASPDRWIAAAGELGVGAELEARIVARALAVAGSMPAGRFLTVNVSPHLLHEPALQDALFGRGRLDGVVVELTEHLPVADLDQFTEDVAGLRAAGAWIALDDAGSGYSGLHQLALVRPDIVKLDRSLVDHADRDEAKLALAELLGIYAGRLDACLLVEGVERVEELGAFQRLGVPLAQGWLFGAGSGGWTDLEPAMAGQIRALRDRTHHLDVVAGLVDPAVTVAAADGHGMAAAMFNADPGLDLVVTVDGSTRPLSLVRRRERSGDGTGQVVASPVTLRVPPSAGLRDVANRAMTRSGPSRFDPVLCVDETGRLLGVVGVERLVLRLAQRRPEHAAPAAVDRRAAAAAPGQRPLHLVGGPRPAAPDLAIHPDQRRTS